MKCMPYLFTRVCTSEVFHFQVLGAGFLSQQWVVEHDFSLSFDSLVELPHGHVAQALHVLTHLVVGLQLKTSLGEKRRGGEVSQSVSKVLARPPWV